eukprot:Sspe_Gene.115959::Locus_104160_Transcript_1_1_Confidence_1.000_Length_789::g.115959::m.115959
MLRRSLTSLRWLSPPKTADLVQPSQEDDEHQMLAAYALHTVECHLKDWERACPSVLPDVLVPGLFVTYEKCFLQNSDQGELRGCMGIMHRSSLQKELPRLAMSAAFGDHRFDAIGPRDLIILRCKVTVLTEREKVSRWDDWVVGKHGVAVTLRCPSTSELLAATFLPEVALQQGWTRRTTMEILLQKAGYKRPITNEVLEKCNVERYEGRSSSLVFSDFLSKYRSVWPPSPCSMA